MNYLPTESISTKRYGTIVIMFRTPVFILVITSVSILFSCCFASAVSPKNIDTPTQDDDETQRAMNGYRLLVDTPFLKSDFNQEVFDNLWKVWPATLSEKARSATPQVRRRMAFQRYGLTARPDNPDKPLQYVVDGSGNWTMNCFACHGGKVYGKPFPGAPNNRFALQTLTEEVRQTKLQNGIPLARMDLGSLVIPLGTTNGTTNAVVFGMGLMHLRDKNLNVLVAPPKRFVHHDMDAPAWWSFYKRPSLYIDGFAQKGHRGLMQFLMIPENDRQFFLEHEDEFRDVYSYISSLRSPAYNGEIDEPLAARGQSLFESKCSQCHGTYGSPSVYPNIRIDLSDIGTDPVRLNALEVEGRIKYSQSWFAHAGEDMEQETVVDPKGYVAPPLDGIWASAPYLHNGSIPTLWHLLNPDSRPQVWRPVSERFDEKLVGISIEEVSEVPVSESDVAIRRSYFDTRKFGKSNKGHDYPAELSASQRRAVLEYLKTL